MMGRKQVIPFYFVDVSTQDFIVNYILDAITLSGMLINDPYYRGPSVFVFVRVHIGTIRCPPLTLFTFVVN